jgi:large-conductance mechanosensitive channel
MFSTAITIGLIIGTCFGAVISALLRAGAGK